MFLIQRILEYPWIQMFADWSCTVLVHNSNMLWEMFVYVMFPLKFLSLWVTHVCEPDLENEEIYFLKCWSFGWKYEQLSSLVQLFSFSRIFSLEFKFQKFYFNFQLNFVELSLGVYWLKLYYFKRGVLRCIEYIHVVEYICI